MFKFLSGKKTYILASLLGLLTAMFWADAMRHDLPETKDLIETGWLTLKTYASIGILLGAGEGAAIRASKAKP